MTSGNRKWSTFRAGRTKQVLIKTPEDIENLSSLDRKMYMAMSCPCKGLRFDSRTLEFLDTDGDGRIRIDEVLSSIAFLKENNFDFKLLFEKNDEDAKKLAEIMARQAAVQNEPPTEEELRAIDEWTKRESLEEISFLGDGTQSAEEALKVVEPLIDEYFQPSSDVQLVTEESTRTLSLVDHINPRYIEAIIDFRTKCVEKILGPVEFIDMLGWKAIKTKFSPYRKWKASRPVAAAGAKDKLQKEEKILRFKMYLLEFLENFVNMGRLYRKSSSAMFQCGTLRIDSREMCLCLPVESEAAHSALADKSKCCILYLSVTRPSDGIKRNVCAVVTAGRTGSLYVGRNGVFYDEEGRECDAVITKIVEHSVSLVEAFWLPWRKIGEAISALVKKFVSDKQSKTAPVNLPQQTEAIRAGGGAVMASSVAAIGIGVAMIGTAMAAVVKTITGIEPWWMIFPALAAVVLAVSLPSVVLVWFKLRKRDIGAILNASGWAINRPIYFSMRRARRFTKCA
ncbi:MAG: phage holin family protein [Kiritimatiellae bacterium]|nr:phage holin family protein [Kiritimatiellia bacterium]